jgi:hypothetical protein
MTSRAPSATKAHRRTSAGRAAGLFALACLALVVAGCGGGARPPSVASLSTTSASGAGSGASRSLAFALPPGGAGIGSSISITVEGAAGVRYAACMHGHGLPGFPEPSSQGVITITVSSALDPGSPLFQRAEAACQHLLPAGKGPSPALQQRQKERLLALAACMRAHGVPDYRDPTFGPGGMVSQGFGAKGGVDPNSPIFQAAQRACRSADAAGTSGG